MAACISVCPRVGRRRADCGCRQAHAKYAPVAHLGMLKVSHRKIKSFCVRALIISSLKSYLPAQPNSGFTSFSSPSGVPDWSLTCSDLPSPGRGSKLRLEADGPTSDGVTGRRADLGFQIELPLHELLHNERGI